MKNYLITRSHLKKKNSIYITILKFQKNSNNKKNRSYKYFNMLLITILL